MVQLASDSNWLKRGRWRAAVAEVLRRPMTPSEIWRAARTLAPRMQLRDVWFILRQLEQRQLVTCFNPKDRTAKVYYWSTRPTVPTLNWHGYAFVMRAKVRRHVLTHLAHRADQPATQIRRLVNARYPVSLNAIIRALRDLRTHQLITIVGDGEKRGQKIYRLTAAGRQIAEQLAHRTDSPQTLLNTASSLSP
jgi:DNA-binding PadR family transcriptional regulator